MKAAARGWRAALEKGTPGTLTGFHAAQKHFVDAAQPQLYSSVSDMNVKLVVRKALAFAREHGKKATLKAFTAPACSPHGEDVVPRESERSGHA